MGYPQNPCRSPSAFGCLAVAQAVAVELPRDVPAASCVQNARIQKGRSDSAGSELQPALHPRQA